MKKHMQAVYINGHGSLEEVIVGERPVPVPGPGEVRVRLAAAGLNRVDIYMAEDGRGFRHDLPLTLGVDGAGIVDCTGPGVVHRQTGERVVIYPARFGRDEFSFRGDQMLSYSRAVPGENIDGCMAEYIVMPEDCIFPVADSLSLLDAAMLPTAYLTAWRAVMTQGAVTDKDWVLIHGIGGGASMAALQFCALRSARSIVTSSSDAKLEVARQQGATCCINYRNEDVLSRVREITCRRGVDVVIENVGAATWETSLKATVGGGRIIVFGATTGPNPPTSLQQIFIRQLQIIGTSIGNFSEFAALISAAERGLFKPLYDSTLRLAQVPTGLARLAASRQTGKIGVIIDPDACNAT
ncbi:MAG: NADPH:quinone reductase [Salinisphaeraceae bacterium]|jgi:NADPH:quinone reductase-like Zn-dependent oxidoreductase|nr:NADPH:quinone reductase [Salinisphaeraceae bacterium]